MSVWSTKSQEGNKEYIVLKHTLPGVNNIINGVKFRGGFAVVEKGSKTYHALKKLPVLKGSKEYPLEILRKLPFITRTSDIKTIFGVEVYLKFITAENESNEIKKAELSIEKDAEIIFGGEKCTFLTPSHNLCGDTALAESPSGYCWRHILKDPKIIDLGIEVPKFIAKADKKAVRDELIEKLAKLKKQGKF